MSEDSGKKQLSNRPTVKDDNTNDDNTSASNGSNEDHVSNGDDHHQAAASWPSGGEEQDEASPLPASSKKMKGIPNNCWGTRPMILQPSVNKQPPKKMPKHFFVAGSGLPRKKPVRTTARRAGQQPH